MHRGERGLFRGGGRAAIGGVGLGTDDKGGDRDHGPDEVMEDILFHADGSEEVGDFGTLLREFVELGLVGDEGV